MSGQCPINLGARSLIVTTPVSRPQDLVVVILPIAQNLTQVDFLGHFQKCSPTSDSHFSYLSLMRGRLGEHREVINSSV